MVDDELARSVSFDIRFPSWIVYLNYVFRESKYSRLCLVAGLLNAKVSDHRSKPALLMMELATSTGCYSAMQDGHSRDVKCKGNIHRKSDS